jgi:hypothetical protein
MVAQASRPLAGSLAQNLAHCGSGDTRSTFDGGAGAPGAAWPGAHELESHQSSFRTVKRNRLALRPSPEHRQSAPAIGVGEPPSDLMTQGAVNALRIGAPLSIFDAIFQ